MKANFNITVSGSSTQLVQKLYVLYGRQNTYKYLVPRLKENSKSNRVPQGSILQSPLPHFIYKWFCQLM